MSQRDLFIALLTPCVIHICRAYGFQGAKPAALDALVDMAARYLEMAAAKTAELAYLNHNGTLPSTTDARMALQYVGLLKPEMIAADEQLTSDDDMRGVEELIEWFRGPAAREIRRIAGLESDSSVTTVAAGGVNVAIETDNGKTEDFLTLLKKKHSKTGDEARFQGTMLGRELDARPRIIEGGTLPSIKAWEAKMRGEPVPENIEAEAGE